MTNYQNRIFEDIKQGAILQCTEGKDYKVWLLYKNGDKKNIRRDSAEKVCELQSRHLLFNNPEGIKYRNFFRKQ